MKSQKIIELIRNGENDIALKLLYKNLPAFKNSFIKSGGNKSEADDIFQDALLVFIEKVNHPTFRLKCHINSFLFSICRNLSLIYFKKKGKNLTIELGDNINYYSAYELIDFQKREEKYTAMDKTLENLGEKCKSILALFYLDKMAIKEITLKLDYKNESTAKTQKFKCLEKAKSLCNQYYKV